MGEQLMKRIFSFIIVFLPIVVMGATVSGSIIDSSNSQGINEMMVILHRFEPNAWENVTFSTVTNSDGSFIVDDVENGQYRLYTAFSDDYFTEYLDETLEIVADDQTIEGIELVLDPIITGRGSISGSIIADDLFLENTSYFMSLKYNATQDYQISMGIHEIDEDMTYSFDDLNTGSYKIGLLFYGQFSGEFWYDTVYSEEEAQTLIIDTNSLHLSNIDFEV